LKASKLIQRVLKGKKYKLRIQMKLYQHFTTFEPSRDLPVPPSPRYTSWQEGRRGLQLLIATTGSILAACDAGIMPARIPTMIQSRRVMPSIGIEIYTGKFSGPDNTNVKR
jgi:hypothetical protein